MEMWSDEGILRRPEISIWDKITGAPPIALAVIYVHNRGEWQVSFFGCATQAQDLSVVVLSVVSSPTRDPTHTQRSGRSES